MNNNLFHNIFIKVLWIYITISFVMEQDSTLSQKYANN